MTSRYTPKPGSPGLPTKGGPSSASPRPHAMLDLKATEVSVTDPANEMRALESPESETAQASPPSVATPETTPPEAPAPTISEADKADTDVPDGVAPTSEPPAKPAPPAPPTFFTTFGESFPYGYVAAALLGGLLAIGGSELVRSPARSPLTGIAAEQERQTANLEKRLAVLEQTAKQPSVDVGISAKVTALETRLARTEEAAPLTADLKQAHDALGEKVAALKQDLAVTAPPADLIQRLAKIEEQFTALAATASDPKAGAVPQLAAFSQKLAEIDAKTVELAKANASIQSGTSERDQALAALKTEIAEIMRTLAATATSDERLQANLGTLGGDLTSAKTSLEKLSATIDAQAKSALKPDDIAAAAAPLAARAEALEARVQTLLDGEAARKAVDRRIVLSLELATLKRTIESGRDFSRELAAVKTAAGDQPLGLEALDRFQDKRLPKFADIESEFHTVSFAMIQAATEPADGSVMDRMLSGAGSFVRIRKLTHSAEDKSAEAVVGRMGAALKTGDLETVLVEAKTLPAAALEIGEAWLAKVEARHAVDRALADVESRLKANLAAETPSSPSR